MRFVSRGVRPTYYVTVVSNFSLLLKNICLFIYFGCAGSQLQYVGSFFVAVCGIFFQLWHAGFLVAACELLVVVCELLVAACMRDLVPRPGIEPRPPALGAGSLSQWTTREVPLERNFKFHCNITYTFCGLCLRHFIQEALCPLKSQSLFFF